MAWKLNQFDLDQIQLQAAASKRGLRTIPVAGIRSGVCITEQSRLWPPLIESITYGKMDSNRRSLAELLSSAKYALNHDNDLSYSPVMERSTSRNLWLI